MPFAFRPENAEKTAVSIHLVSQSFTKDDHLSVCWILGEPAKDHQIETKPINWNGW